MPSRKFIVIFLCVLVVGGMFWFAKNSNAVKAGKENPKQIAFENTIKTAAQKITESDADGDGLKDWEEVLWKTDPKKDDTDGDGFKDGVEIAGGYDPFDKFSNEKEGNPVRSPTYSQYVGDNFQLSTSNGVNFTEEVAKGMGTKIIESGGEAEPDFSDPMALLGNGTDQAMAEYMASLNVAVSDSELKISKDNSKTAVQKYADETNKIFAIFDDPIFKQDPSTMFGEGNVSSMARISDIYGQAGEEFKKVSVPSDILDAHKRLIELFMSNRNAFASVADMDKDPLKAMLGIQASEKINEEIDAVMIKFTSLFKEKGIN